MTVICWDGKTLAADSRVTCSNMITTDKFDKIHVFKEGVDYLGDKLLAAGFAGSCQDVNKFLHHITRYDQWWDSSFNFSLNIIIVGVKHVYEVCDNNTHCITYKRDTQLTAGSGYQVAQSALALGHDAVTACKLACKLCIDCGGKIKTWRDE